MKWLKTAAVMLLLSMTLSACSEGLPENPAGGGTAAVETGSEQESREPAGETPAEEPQEAVEEEPEEEPVEEPKAAGLASAEEYLAARPNELGHVMVVMYHGILDNPPYHRTREDFLKDLAYLYEHGYYLVPLSDFLEMDMDVPAGKTPIVLTFDDGLSTTFNLVEGPEGPAADPESAIGLLEGFVAEHPDFGKAASLFIHVSGNFEGGGTESQRLQWLVDNGYELGNHSATHENLSKLDAAGLQKAIGRVNESVAAMLPGYVIDTMTYPFGIRPQDQLLPLFENGSWNGVDYGFRIGFREGPSAPFRVPLHVKYDHLNAPRVRGSEGEVQDLWWFLDYYEKNPGYRYISDGNPDRLSMPVEEYQWVDKSFQASGTIYLYDPATGEQQPME